jgi:DNA-binding CsgD family transcriptional regulator
VAALAVSEPDRGGTYPDAAGASLLTPRQAEVVKLAQRGMVAKEIARQLGISKRTVEAHLGEARRRVGVTSTVALVGSVIVGARATGGESSYSCSENAGISEQVITRVGAEPPPRPDRQRRGRPTVMTDDMIAKARVLLPSHSISDIARHLKVSRTTIYAHMGQIRGTRELRARGQLVPQPARAGRAVVDGVRKVLAVRGQDMEKDSRELARQSLSQMLPLCTHFILQKPQGYDYFPGGKDNYAADRAAVGQDRPGRGLFRQGEPAVSWPCGALPGGRGEGTATRSLRL